MAHSDRLPDVGFRPVTPHEGLATLVEDATVLPPGARTSDTDPYEVGWVGLDDVLGRLGIGMAPGRHDRVGAATWWRDLHADLRRLRHVHRADLLVTLLTDEELRDLGIANLADELEVHGLEGARLPIRDGGVPGPQQVDETMGLLYDVVRHLRDGHTVVVHCRAGQGRSGMWAAMALAALGADPAEAIARVRRVQPRAVETVGQEAYVEQAATAWLRRRLGAR
ncbi:MAG: tyrosine-protein phosphatase [Trueperaceae bacterium]|nr:tyrosine-protein phosphatase [Trueperaceae bacterium]